MRDREETTLVNIYWTPNNSRANPEEPSFLRDLPTGRNTVIAGDFNAHSSWDSCQNEDQRGREVEDWILGSNLHCVNDCDTHTRTNPATGGHSSPDLKICSGDIADDIRTSWKTGEDVGSDHLPITWDLPHKRARQARPQPKWCYKNADWNAFRDALSTMKPEGRSLEEENSNFLKSVLRAAKLAIPKGARKGCNKPFWSDACKKAKTEREKARKDFETSPTIENIQSYKEKRAQADSTIKKEKQRIWNSKCNELSLDTDLFRTLKNFRGDGGQQKDSATIKRSGDAGQPLRDAVTDCQKADLFCQIYAKVSRVEHSREGRPTTRQARAILKQECGCNKENACSAFRLTLTPLIGLNRRGGRVVRNAEAFRITVNSFLT